MANNKLIFETALDGTGFQRGMAQLGSSAAAGMKNLVAGAFGVYSLNMAIAKTVESASNLVDASQRLDITVEKLQVLKEAAKQAGAQFGSLETAFERLNVAREKALGGDKGALQAFGRLGVTPDMLRSQSAASLFMGPIAQTARTMSAEDLAKPLRDILGKGFGELLPVLKSDFEDLSNTMQRLGSIMSTEAAVSVDMLADQFGLLSNIIAAQLAPGLATFADWILRGVGVLKAFGSFFGSLVGGLVPSINQNTVGTSGFDTIKGIGEGIKSAVIEAGIAGAMTLIANDEMIEAMHKAVAANAARLRNPPKPTFEPAAADNKEAIKQQVKQTAIASDSLTSVGNFLGAKNNISDLAQKQVDKLTQIEANQRRAFDYWSGANQTLVFSGL